MNTSAAAQTQAIGRTDYGRWIYFLTASLLVVTALVGFVPRSIEILTGARRNPPMVVHIHAALIAAWMALLFFQTLLVALRRTAAHKTLGLLSFAIGPAVFASMVAVTIWRFGDNASHGQTAFGSSVLLTQMRAIIYFGIFFTWAMIVRRSDPETHKRMIILASLVPMGAAIARMTWLPGTLPEAYTSVHLCMLLLIAPLIACDVARLGRPHKAWILGIALLLPWMVFTELMWNNPWWIATATRLMGY